MSSKYGAFIIGEPQLGTGKYKKRRQEFPEDFNTGEDKDAGESAHDLENGASHLEDVEDENTDEELREVVNAGLHDMEEMINTMKNVVHRVNSVEIPLNLSEEEETDRKEEECPMVMDGIEKKVRKAEKNISDSVEPNIIEKMAQSTKRKISDAADFVRKAIQ